MRRPRIGRAAFRQVPNFRYFSVENATESATIPPTRRDTRDRSVAFGSIPRAHARHAFMANVTDGTSGTRVCVLRMTGGNEKEYCMMHKARVPRSATAIPAAATSVSPPRNFPQPWREVAPLRQAPVTWFLQQLLGRRAAPQAARPGRCKSCWSLDP